MLLLDRNIASSARLELDGLKGKLNDKSFEDTLDGRLMIAEDRLDDALRTLSRVVEADPRRVDATLLAGAAAAKARKDGKAWEFCLKRGLRADPASRPVGSLTPYFVRPADLLKPAVGAYSALVKNADEDPSASLCDGLVEWFSEDYAGADRDFAKTIHIDPRNSDAFAYRALAALKKRDVAGAARLAAKAVDSSKTNGNAYYAQAQVLMASKKPDLAKVAAESALKYTPQSLGAKVILADVDARRGNNDDARRTLTTVLLADSYYRDAKRVLYEHEL
jgi:predicted Zn-dependent protease